MPAAKAITEALAGSSMIRKMFEEGRLLKQRHGAGRVFDFSLGNPDVEPPPEFRAALLDCVNDTSAGTHGYMPNAGFAETRRAMAEKASREHGVAVDASCVVMAVGAAGALNTVFKAVLNPGDEVIVTRPFFMEYRPYAANHGGVLVEVDAAPDFNLDVEAVRKALTPKTAAVLINSPNNPTGRVYPENAIAALAAALGEHGAKTGRFPYLVADEPYRELVYDGLSVPPVLSAYRHSIVVTSFSKSLSLPGERIGYIAVAPDIDDKERLLAGLIYATRVLGFVNAPALMQRCVARAAHAHVDTGLYARRRAAFMRVLRDAGLSFAEPEGAFYLFVRVPAHAGAAGDDGAFAEHLKKHLILGVPGVGFGARSWIRFAYCVDEHTITAAAAAFKEAVRSFPV